MNLLSIGTCTCLLERFMCARLARTWVIIFFKCGLPTARLKCFSLSKLKVSILIYLTQQLNWTTASPLEWKGWKSTSHPPSLQIFGLIFGLGAGWGIVNQVTTPHPFHPSQTTLHPCNLLQRGPIIQMIQTHLSQMQSDSSC